MSYDPENMSLKDLKLVTEYQKFLHKDNENDEDDVLDCRFSYTFSKMPFSSKAQEYLNTDNNKIFFVNKSYTFLLSSFLSIDLPLIEVSKDKKDHVEICWCPKVGLAIIEHGAFVVDNINVQEYNFRTLDNYYQYFMDDGYRKIDLFKSMIGDTEENTSWGTTLNRVIDLEVPQPWYFSKGEMMAFPLYISHRSSVEFRYKFNLKINKLLRMRIKKNGVWVEIPCNNKFLENITSDFEITPPRVIGEYAKLDNDEIEFLVDNNKKKGVNIIYEDYVTYSTENSYTYGDIISRDIHSLYPCKHIFVVCENIDSFLLNNYFNYTTNTHDVENGKCPKTNLKCLYGAVPRFIELGPNMFKKMACYKYFPSYPENKGYSVIPIAYKSTTLNSDVGIVFNNKINGKISVKLIHPDILNSELNDQKKIDEIKEIDEYNSNELTSSKIVIPNTKYKLYIFMMVIRRLTFTVDGKCKIIIPDEE